MDIANLCATLDIALNGHKGNLLGGSSCLCKATYIVHSSVGAMSVVVYIPLEEFIWITALTTRETSVSDDMVQGVVYAFFVCFNFVPSAWLVSWFA